MSVEKLEIHRMEINGVLKKKVELVEKVEVEQCRTNDDLKKCNGQSSWYQCPLPKPPLPDPEHTLKRYLEYARVLAHTYPDELKLADTEQRIAKFGEKLAPKLQAKLAQIAESSDNWINQFWLPEMYLRQRMPLPVNFNPAYVFPRQNFASEKDQIDYAAWLVRGLLDFKSEVDQKLFPCETMPDRFSEGQTVRMCMDQYERILNCYREPREQEDIQHDRRTINIHSTNDHLMENGDKSGCEDGIASDDDDIEHIAVIVDRQQFVLFTRRPDNNSALSAPEIARQLAKVRKIARNRARDSVQPVGGAGTGPRDKAAEFWVEMEKVPSNRRSLSLIRSAVFVLCLDDNNRGQEQEEDKLSRMERDGLQILHGFGPTQNGLNRWFDATIQLVVSRNGCCGLCIEHSVAEGIVIINMAEGAMRFANANWRQWQHKDDEDQQIGQSVQNNVDKSLPANSSVRSPKCLPWALSEKAIQLIREQIAEFDQISHDVQLRVLQFTQFGKAAIKGWHISPDGFVQLALQLAHFKLHGYLVSTYESCTMRRFRFGRVDNIRAATLEALEWAKVMGEKGSAELAQNGSEKQAKTAEEKKALFMAAARKQAVITRENVTGHGIDNHLCALEVLSREEADADQQTLELFKDSAWRELMRFPLTTSQVSTSPEFVDCFLFYGPVVRDGYVCAYNIQQDKLIFAISAWKSDGRTEADKLRECLEEALEEMGKMLEGAKDKRRQN